MADGSQPKPRARRSKAPTTPDPVEIAMEAVAGGAGELTALGLLEDHRRLIGWQIASERAGLALKGLAGCAGLAVAGALGVMAWEAAHARGLIVEPFSVPPQLAQEGLTGEVVASRVLDRMSAMQASVQSQRAPSSFARRWDGDVRLAIPQTGITVAELDRQLRVWLGHETHVTGEVLQRAGRMTVTVRGAPSTADTFQGAPDELDALIERAGEAAFARTEPYRYAIWLLRVAGRPAEGKAALARLTHQGPLSDRAWGYTGLATVVKDEDGMAVQAEYLRAAQRLAPWQMLPPSNLGSVELELGRPEAARRSLAAAARNANPRGEVRSIDITTDRVEGTLALIEADYGRALKAWTMTVEGGNQGANQNIMGLVVRSRLGLHEVAAAKAALSAPNPDIIGPTPTVMMDTAIMRLRVWVAEGDWEAAARERAAAEGLAVAQLGVRDRVGLFIRPLAAWALAQQGDAAGARALVAATPLDSYDAVIMRGQVAARLGAAGEADRWFGRAEVMAPRSAFAEQAWAEARLARGDVDGAIEKARAAARKAPRFGDPLETWGEALLVKGDAAGAAGKFAAAARLAPNWGRLHLKWALALARIGKTDEARTQRQVAAVLDLTPTERAELAALRI